MQKLEELIQKLCPNGVEYKKICEVTNILRGKRLTKSQLLEDGLYPVYHGSLSPLGYYNKANRESDTVIVVNTGGIGGVGYSAAPFWCSDGCFCIEHCKILINKFIYYFLVGFQDYFVSRIRTGGVPTIDKDTVGNIKIPIPPIEVQEEIVRILDKFTELSAELTAELTARKKQYEFYRDNILNFSNDVPRYKLAEIFNTRNGYTPSKNNKQFWNTSEISWFRMEDIRENGRILDKAIQGVSISAVKGKAFPKNSIIISTSATIGEHALIKCESLANQRFTYLILKDEYKDKYNIMFLFYYCFVLDEYCKENLNQGNFASVDMRKFNEFEFPMPSLEEQDHIVAILDRFDKLCNDISEGLPAEIEARQKQYEYYRDKLLNFKEIAQ